MFKLSMIFVIILLVLVTLVLCIAQELQTPLQIYILSEQGSEGGGEVLSWSVV